MLFLRISQLHPTLHLGPDLYVHLMDLFSFRTMSASQAQHKLDTLDDINSITFLGGPAGVSEMFTRRKTKSLSPGST